MTNSSPMTHSKFVDIFTYLILTPKGISLSIGRADACWRKAKSRRARMLPAALRYSPATLDVTAASLTDQVKKVRDAAWSGSFGMSCKCCQASDANPLRHHSLISSTLIV